MATFVHLSDLHIHKSMSKPDNLNTGALVRFLVDRHASTPNADKPAILITGDIVDDGHGRQYGNAARLLKPLVDNGFRVLPCPGNHDYGLWGIDYEPRSQRHFRRYILVDLIQFPAAMDRTNSHNDIFPMSTVLNGVMFIGLDSVVGNLKEIHIANGEVGADQRAKLVQLLDEATQQNLKTVVYFHHHPFMRRHTHPGLDMDDAREVMRILTNRIDFLCFGHKHESESWPCHYGIDWVIASGKSSERNDQHKLQYREITIDDSTNEVTMVTFKPK